LFLASGGYALADFNASTTAIHSFSDSDTADGWTEGAGNEYAWTDNLILRAEYRHAEFGEAGLSLDGSSQDISSGQDMVQVGASWKF
jgi:outer membrane immunogenic protein